MIFFVISILALVFFALFAYRATSLRLDMYASTKDFVNAKCSLYNGARMFLFPAFLATYLGVSHLASNPGMEGYVTELLILLVLLTAGFVALSLRMRKLERMVGKNAPIEKLERA